MSLDNLRDDIATKQKKRIAFYYGICCGMDIYYCYSYFEY